MSGKMDEVDIQEEVASGVLALFNDISDFIYNLINPAREGVASVPSATASSTYVPIKDVCKRMGFINNSSSVLRVKYKINDNTNIYLNIPTAFNLDSNGLVQLDNNRLFVEAFNEKHKQQISLIQYYRFDKTEKINCVVIHLIIKVGPDDATNRQNIYICFEYDKDGNIKKVDDSVCVYDNFNNYAGSKFAGVAPNLNSRSRRSNYQYLFSIQYDQMIKDANTSRATNTLPPVKKDAASQRSPAKTLGTIYDSLPVSTRMYSMYTHSVEGLGKIAEERYSLYDDDIKMLSTTETTNIPTMERQISKLINDKSDIKNDIKLAQAVNDLIDLAHDFEKIPDYNNYINTIYSHEDQSFKDELKKRLTGLLSLNNYNINIVKSHELQKSNIVELTNTLRANSIIFPDIPSEKYLSRMQVFAEFIADMMSNPPPRRSNYTESGKQVTIATFTKYYNESLDEADQISFNEHVMRIMTAGSGAGADSGINKYLNGKDKYPSILKKIGLDGCDTGDSDSIEVDETITDVYGIFNVNIKGNNNSTFDITISRSDTPLVPLLSWNVVGAFHITYDDVANYINEIDKDLTDKFNTRGDNKEINAKYKDIKFNESVKDNKLKRLLLQCLKTFCDKIYRTSMKDKHTKYEIAIAEGVTHVCTTDSYFYGDAILQYLAGKVDYIPTILRSGTEKGAGAECNDGTNTGRGFYTNPGVNSSTYIDRSYQAILKKTLGYASILQNLANECCVQVADTFISESDSGSVMNSDSDSDSDSSRKNDSISVSGSPRSTKAPMRDVFKLRNLLTSGINLFDTSSDNLGRFIDGNIHSYRLINFVDRFGLNYNDNYKKSTTDDYESKINELFHLEGAKVINSVNDYVVKLQQIMGLSTIKNVDDIKKGIIELPNLEYLLTMSTPSFCYENDDTLLLEPDKPTYKVVGSSKLPLTDSSEDDTSTSSMSQTTQIDLPSFTSVIFYLNELTINGANDHFKEMQKDQLVKEYKISNANNTITGPITLDLLYTLKSYTTDSGSLKEIDTKINEIINDFCSSCGLNCNDDNVATQMVAVASDLGARWAKISRAQSMTQAQREAYEAGYDDNTIGKYGGDDKDNLIVYNRFGINDRENKKDFGTSLNESAQMSAGIGVFPLDLGTSSGSDNDDTEMSDSAPRTSEQERLDLVRESGAFPLKRTKSTGSNGGRPTRKRTPSKIPRRTIRRRATRRGQKRTIRRQRRNKKGTQKRRK